MPDAVAQVTDELAAAPVQQTERGGVLGPNEFDRGSRPCFRYSGARIFRGPGLDIRQCGRGFGAMDIIKAGEGGGKKPNGEGEVPEGAARGLERYIMWRQTRPQCMRRCSSPTTAAVVGGVGFRCGRGGGVGGYPAAVHACMRR